MFFFGLCQNVTFYIYFCLTRRPARQSTVTVLCVSACNCKPRNYLW